MDKCDAAKHKGWTEGGESDFPFSTSLYALFFASCMSVLNIQIALSCAISKILNLVELNSESFDL